MFENLNRQLKDRFNPDIVRKMWVQLHGLMNISTEEGAAQRVSDSVCLLLQPPPDLSLYTTF